jgi:chaperone BCS1
LNAIDGVAAGEGRLLFATTNHPEKLDPALIRPGRIDRRVEIGLADREQLARMFRRFYPNAETELAERFAANLPDRQLAMSSVQTHLVQHAASAEEACARIDELPALPVQLGSPRSREAANAEEVEYGAGV